MPCGVVLMTLKKDQWIQTELFNFWRRIFLLFESNWWFTSCIKNTQHSGPDWSAHFHAHSIQWQETALPFSSSGRGVLFSTRDMSAHLVQQTNHVLNEYTVHILMLYVYLYAVRVKSWNCSVLYCCCCCCCFYFYFAHNLFVNVLFARIRNT